MKLADKPYISDHSQTRKPVLLKVTEKQLVQDLQAHPTKEAAFRQLVSQYKERLYWHIRNMLKNHDDTDDVLQNTFIKIYKNIHQFNGQSQLYSWMYRIATNESINFLNQKARKQQISSEELQQQIVDQLQSDVYFEGDEIQLQLQRAVATLPDKQQQVFNMKYFQDLKYREISHILGTSEGALKASYHIAVRKIKEFLNSH